MFPIIKEIILNIEENLIYKEAVIAVTYVVISYKTLNVHQRRVNCGTFTHVDIKNDVYYQFVNRKIFMF
jgi:hypothetical protein